MPPSVISVKTFLLKTNLVATGGEAKRMVAQAAVSINGEKIQDPFAQVKPEDGMIAQVGKRKFAKIKVVESHPTT